jgi:hypothetical protein
MTPSLNSLRSTEHAADLQRAATRYTPGTFAAGRKPTTVALRLAKADDARALKILAELDEESELSGEALLALIDGELVAAMSLNDGRVVSNPFVATADAVSLLRLRARHLSGVARRNSRRRWRPRFV